MMTPDPAALPPLPPRPARPASFGDLPETEVALLGYVAEMYGLQMDQLAALLRDWGEPAGSAADRARELVARWRAAGLADSEELTLGEPWVWASAKCLDACGMRTKLVKPATLTLRHVHAVAEVRLAVERTSAHRRSQARWQPERSIVAGRFPARHGHVPDGEVHYPAGTGAPWAGETWAVEVELSRKSVARVAAIMQATLDRTGDFATPPGSYAVPGQPPRYDRVVYLASPTSVLTVLNARGEVGSPQSARVEVYELPDSMLRLNAPKKGRQP